MAEYKSSKQILAKAKDNLNKVEKQEKDIKEEAISISQEVDKKDTLNSLKTKLIKSSEANLSSLKETYTTLNNLKSSLIGLKSAVEQSAVVNNTINSLLASNLISLTQINSVLSAFRSDYILTKNGETLKGYGYYDTNAIINSLGINHITDNNIKAILRNIDKAANYANKSSNKIRGMIGNSNLDTFGDKENIVDKLMGKIQQGAQFASILQLIPGKIGQTAKQKISRMDLNNGFGNFLGSLMSDKNKANILNPLKELGMDLQGANDPISKKLGELMKKAGLTKAKKQRETDPNLVMSSLAPFADDIKDLVEFKVKALHTRPKSIPDFATPIWIVNSKDQTNYIGKHYQSKDSDLVANRILEILEGRATNTKDKYGNDLLTRENGIWKGSLAEGRNRKTLDNASRIASQNVYNRNHERYGYRQTDEKGNYIGDVIYDDNNDATKAIKDFSRVSSSGLLNALPNMSLSEGSFESNVMNLVQTIQQTGLGDGLENSKNYLKSAGKALFHIGKNIVVGSHKGGRKAKKRHKRKNEKEITVRVHQGERILGAEALEEQEALNNTSKVLGTIGGMLNSIVSLTQMKTQLFSKYVNGDTVIPDEIKTNKEIIGESVLRSIGDYTNIKPYMLIPSDVKTKFANKISENLTTSEYFSDDETVEPPTDIIPDASPIIVDDSETDEQVSEAKAQNEKMANEEIQKHKEELEERVEEQKAQDDAEYAEEQKIKEDFKHKKWLKEKAKNTKKWLIEKAAAAKARAIKWAGMLKGFKAEKDGEKKISKNTFKSNAKRLAKKFKNTIKREGKHIGKKVKNVVKRLISHLTWTNIKTNAKNFNEKLKSNSEKSGSIIETIGGVAGKAIDAIKAVPIYGKVAALAASAALGVSITGIGFSLLKGLKSGKEQNIDINKTLSITDKYKNEAEKKSNEENKNEDSNNIGKQKENEKVNEDVKNIESIKTENNYTSNNKKNIIGKLTNLIPNNNDLLKYLNKKQIQALISGSKSKFAKLMLKDPTKAANIIFLLNNGAALANLKNTKSSDLNNIDKATNNTSNQNNIDDNNGTVWNNLLKELNTKKELLSDDIGSEGYSEDVTVASLQNMDTKEKGTVLNAFAKMFGMSVLEDDDGNAIFTTTARKNAQQEALTKNLGNASSLASNSTTSSSASSSANTNTTDENKDEEKYDGSKYIDYAQDGTWSNSITESEINDYFTTSNGNTKENPVVKILNNNWIKYKTDNGITDQTKITSSNNSSMSYPRRFFVREEYPKIYRSYASSWQHFKNSQAKTLMHRKLAESIKDSDAWNNPVDMYTKGSKERQYIKDSIKKKTNYDYSKFGLGRVNKNHQLDYGTSDDFLDASQYALNNGFKEPNGGTYPRFFNSYLGESGISVKQDSSINSIKNSLAAGNPVILMGNNPADDDSTPFGPEPHYVVADGYDGRNIRVIDSESQNTYDYYNANNVLNHSTIKLSTSKKLNSSKKTARGSRSFKSKHTSSGRSRVFRSRHSTATNTNKIRKRKYLRSARSRYGKGQNLYEAKIDQHPNLIKAAQEGWTQYGILASVTLAQACLESMFGESQLAREANNWFGHSLGFSSEKYRLPEPYSMTTSWGNMAPTQWARYRSAEDCFKDHAYVLSGQSGNERYLKAVGETDPHKAIYAIANGGYCKDTDVVGVTDDGTWYSNHVMEFINDNNLRKYDVGSYNGKAASGGGTKYSKICWTGDSRTEQMHNYFPDLEVVATKGGMTISYFNDHYSEAKAKIGYNIFCWYGVNGATKDEADKTAEAYNRLAADLKGKSQVFAGTIGHCPNGSGSNRVDGGCGQSLEEQNKGVEEFNAELKTKLSSDIILIDTYSYIKKLEEEMGAAAMSTDNLHYTKECSEKIRNYVAEQINSASGAVSSATPSTGYSVGAIGDLYVTLQGYTDAKDILSKYKKGDDLWDNDDLTFGAPTSSDGSAVIPATNYDTNDDNSTEETSTATPSNNQQTTKPNNNTSSAEVSPDSSSSSSDGSNNTPSNSNSVVQPDTNTNVYTSNGTLYIVNNIEYGIKTNIEKILDEFKELNNIQDDSLDVLNIIYQKLLKKKGLNKNMPISGYDYSLKRRFV